MGEWYAHVIPASVFLGFSSFILLLTLKRCLALKANPQNTRSFCEVHVPENNTTLLLVLGRLICGLTTVAIVLAGGWGMVRKGSFFDQFAHLALYFCFFFLGCVTILEARRAIAPDSSKIALAFVFLLQYVVWNEHGLMKKTMGDRRVHLLQAQINLAAAVAFAFSVLRKDSLLAYVSGWAVMFLNGLWLVTAGLSLCCIEITAHTAGATLVLETLLVAAMVTAGATCCFSEQGEKPVTHYSSIATATDTDDTTEEDEQAVLDKANPVC